MRVLLGEISSYKAIVIARHIREMYPDVEIWAYDSKPLLSKLHTKYIDQYTPLKNCGHDKDAYVAQLATCLRKIQADVLIPVHSDYIGEILRHKIAFGHALDYMGRYEDYLQLHEKDKLMALAKEVGVRIPVNYTSTEVAKVPFVVKPTALSSAQGVRYCMQEEERATFIPMSPHMVCQEYIAGHGCGYSVYCQDGKILHEYGHLRLAEFPISGGSSVYRQRFLHPGMREVAEKILSRVPWTGFAMFEFKLSPTGDVVLIEVNPRIWGSIHQALAAGTLLFEGIFHESKLQPVASNPDIRTCLWPQVILSVLEYGFKKGDWNVMKEYFCHDVEKDVSFFGDFGGFASMIIRKLL